MIHPARRGRSNRSPENYPSREQHSRTVFVHQRANLQWPTSPAGECSWPPNCFQTLIAQPQTLPIRWATAAPLPSAPPSNATTAEAPPTIAAADKRLWSVKLADRRVLLNDADRARGIQAGADPLDVPQGNPLRERGGSILSLGSSPCRRSHGRDDIIGTDLARTRNEIGS